MKMAQPMWILVEWVDENDTFPIYGVVNVNMLVYKETDLEPGKEISLSLKRSEPRRAKIIRISESKRLIKEHKIFLERQDQQVKNVLQLCMRTIKEMKTDQFSSSVENSFQLNRIDQDHNGSNVINAMGDSSNESEEESKPYVHKSTMLKTYKKQMQNQNIHRTNNSVNKTVIGNKLNQSHTTNSSTPMASPRNDIKRYTHQCTQTESALSQPTAAKIQEIETVLQHLYARFQSLVMKANNSTTEIQVEEVEPRQHEIMAVDQIGNAPWDNPDTQEENTALINNSQKIVPLEVACEENSPRECTADVSTKAIKTEVHNDIKRVRRMSAQTTDSINELVPIGNGHALVPSRLLNEIDWNSYTSATRQLLQAIFPRKVLATHSLTGKQSPAHQNKPAKKLLDPNLVDDVVETVSATSGVPKNLVRNIITVKCTDEAKLYRNRQRHKMARNVKKQHDENAPPPLASSDELSIVTCDNTEPKYRNH